MKKFFTVFVMAGMVTLGTQSATAADFDAQQAIQGLVVSGVVDSWNGYTFIGSQGGDNATGGDAADPDSYLASGLSGRLSLPLGENLSIQMDGDLEYTDNAFDDENTDEVFLWSSQLGAHVTWRDPNMGAVGAFGSFGRTHSNEDRQDFYAVGGEAQMYLEDLTLYVQAGYLDSHIDVDPGDEDRFDSFHNAVFVRGVARWFISPDSRLQGEVSYATGDQDSFASNGNGTYDMDIFEWRVRYDTVLAGLPLIGDTQVHVGYRGARFDNDGNGANDDDGRYTEHTIMVGTTHSFGGGTLREFDRVGATLDLPGFGRWVGAGNNLD